MATNNDEAESILELHEDSIMKHKEKIKQHREWLLAQKDPDVEFEPDFSKYIDSGKESKKKVDGNHAVERIEDRLLRDGKVMENKKEEMRKRYQQELEKELRFRPKISQPDYYPKDGKIEERLVQKENARQEILERKRNEIFQKEYPFAPKISENSKGMVPYREDINDVASKWVESKTNRLEQARETKKNEELAALRKTPQLSERTMKLLKKMKYRSTVSLEDYHERKQFERLINLRKLQDEDYSKKYRSKPEISPVSKKIVERDIKRQDSSVSDRLYQDSIRMRNEREEEKKRLVRRNSEKPIFKPNITRSSQYFDSFREVNSVFEDLIQKGNTQRSIKAAQLELLLEKERKLHHPKIDPVSKEIANRLPTSSRERLYKSNQKRPKSPFEKFTFSPQINKKSKRISRDIFESPREYDGKQDPLTRLYINDQRRREKIQDLARKYDRMEMEQCSFSPNLSKSKQIAEKEFNNGDLYSLSFEERHNEWINKRKSKQKAAQYKKELSEIQECTFQPKLMTKTYSPATPQQRQFQSPTSKTPEPNGYFEFVERQKEGHQKRQQQKKKEQLLARSGIAHKSPKAWKNRVTVPKPFRLGKDRISSPKISSLAKQCSPPTFRKHIQKLHQSGMDIHDFDLDGSTQSDLPSQSSPLHTESIPRQGLFSTKSSIHILESLNSAPMKDVHSSENYGEE